MAVVLTDVVSYLSVWDETFEQFYRDGVVDILRRFGKTSRSIPRNPKRIIQGKQMEVTVRQRWNRSARYSVDGMAAPPAPIPGDQLTFNINFEPTTPTSNDFAFLRISWRTTWYDMKKSADATFKDGDTIRVDIEQGLEDVAEEFASSFHRSEPGLLGTGPAAGALLDVLDSSSNLATYNQAQAYQAGATRAWMKLDNGAIAHIGVGEVIDVYHTSATTIYATNLRVVLVDPALYAIMVEVIPSGDQPGQTTRDGTNAETDLDFLDTDIGGAGGAAFRVYLSGTQGVAANNGSLEYLFDQTQTTYFDRDRKTSPYAMLWPQWYDAAVGGSTAVQLDVDHFRIAGEMISWQNGDFNAVDKRMVSTNRDQFRAINFFHKDEGLTMVPAMQADLSPAQKAAGFQGWVIYDPVLGEMQIQPDDLAAYGQVSFLDLSTWEFVTPYGGADTIEFLPGTFNGTWSRLHYDGSDADNPAGVPSKVFLKEGQLAYAWITTGPQRNTRILNLKKDV